MIEVSEIEFKEYTCRSLTFYRPRVGGRFKFKSLSKDIDYKYSEIVRVDDRVYFQHKFKYVRSIDDGLSYDGFLRMIDYGVLIIRW